MIKTHSPFEEIILVHMKSATHYSLLFADSEATTFSWKKFCSAKHDEKRSTHYSSWTAVFAYVCSNWKYPWMRHKKYLFVFVKRPPTLVNTFPKKVFHKALTNHDKSHFMHCSHFARVSSVRSFLSLLANSV